MDKIQLDAIKADISIGLMTKSRKAQAIICLRNKDSLTWNSWVGAWHCHALLV
jgi:hypothetical protein